jgi:hypothetical protein
MRPVFDDDDFAPGLIAADFVRRNRHQHAIASGHRVEAAGAELAGDLVGAKPRADRERHRQLASPHKYIWASLFIILVGRFYSMDPGCVD